MNEAAVSLDIDVLDMGMTSPFNDADFSKMSDTDLVITSVIQKSYINVSVQAHSLFLTDATRNRRFL